MSHRNAPLTPTGRLRLARCVVDDGWPLRREWAYQRPYTTDAERQAAFPDWLDWYNHHRPHTGISGQTPASRVTNLSGQHTLAALGDEAGAEVHEGFVGAVM